MNQISGIPLRYVLGYFPTAYYPVCLLLIYIHTSLCTSSSYSRKLRPSSEISQALLIISFGMTLLTTIKTLGTLEFSQNRSRPPLLLKSDLSHSDWRSDIFLIHSSIGAELAFKGLIILLHSELAFRKRKIRSVLSWLADLIPYYLQLKSIFVKSQRMSFRPSII